MDHVVPSVLVVLDHLGHPVVQVIQLDRGGPVRLSDPQDRLHQPAHVTLVHLVVLNNR